MASLRKYLESGFSGCIIVWGEHKDKIEWELKISLSGPDKRFNKDVIVLRGSPLSAVDVDTVFLRSLRRAYGGSVYGDNVTQPTKHEELLKKHAKSDIDELLESMIAGLNQLKLLKTINVDSHYSKSCGRYVFVTKSPNESKGTLYFKNRFYCSFDESKVEKIIQELTSINEVVDEMKKDLIKLLS